MTTWCRNPGARGVPELVQLLFLSCPAGRPDRGVMTELITPAPAPTALPTKTRELHNHHVD
jgi:hypothetical protein